MTEIANMVVELGERFDAARANGVREEIHRMGYVLEETRGADEAVLAWMDEIFGGAWSSEAFMGWNVVVRRGAAPAAFATFDSSGLDYHWLRGAASAAENGIFGPFGVAPDVRGTGVGPLVLDLALCGLRERGYRRAIVPAVGPERLRAYYQRYAGAREIERFDLQSAGPTRVRTLVMASGSGTNFQAVIDRVRRGDLPLDITALIANNRQAFAIERARQAGIPVRIEAWKRSERTRAQYDAALLDAAEAEAPQLVLLLGWMHLLAPAFVERFPHLVNVHPAFLPLDPAADDVAMPDGTRIPAFRGPRAVDDAFAAESSWIGASVHLVTPQTDRGRILVRKPLRLEPNDDVASALARLHPIEHELVDGAIRRWINERPA